MMRPMMKQSATRAMFVGLTLASMVTTACGGIADEAEDGEALATATSAVRVPVFSGWHEVPGGGSTAIPDTSAVLNGRLYLFGVGNDHQHYVNATSGASWTGWSLIPGGGSTPLPDAAVTFRHRIYLFGMGNDQAHYLNRFDGNSWTGWSEVPGGGRTPYADTAVVFRDRLYLFGIGADHAHYVNVFDESSWTGWSQVPGGGSTSIADTAAVLDGRLYLFGVGNDHRHYVNSFDGASWTGWSQVPGNGTTLLASSATTHDGQIVLVGLGIDDHAHYQNVFDGSTWSGWRLVEGNGVTDIADHVTSFSGRLYLFGLGFDRKHYVNVGAAQPQERITTTSPQRLWPEQPDGSQNVYSLYVGQNVNQGRLVGITNRTPNPLSFIGPHQPSNDCWGDNSIKVAAGATTAPGQLAWVYESVEPGLPVAIRACLYPPLTALALDVDVTYSYQP